MASDHSLRMNLISLRAILSSVVALSAVPFFVACGEGESTPGTGRDEVEAQDQDDSADGEGDQSGDCVEVTVSLGAVSGNGDYNEGGTTSPLAGASADHLVLELYDGLDTPNVDIANDSKNRKPTTCEACGWIFEDGDGLQASRIYYQESGQISLTVPDFGRQLSTAPEAGTLTDVTFREVALDDPNDLYSARPLVGGACIHVTSASFSSN